MSTKHAVYRIQVCFPQVYFTCHTKHHRKRTNEFRLSDRDSSILAHLDPNQSMSFTDLKNHLRLAKSTLSEALKKLASTGYVVRRESGREVHLTLSEKGMSALSATSVLEPDTLSAVLEGLSSSAVHRIVDGMEQLAEACRNFNRKGEGK